MNLKFFLILSILSVLITSCKDDKKSQENVVNYLIQDLSNETPWDLILIPNESENISFFNVNENGMINHMDIVDVNVESVLSISTNNDGRIESISNGTSTLVFSYLSDTDFNIVAIEGDEVNIFDNLQLKNLSQSRAWYDDIEQSSFNQSLYAFSKEFGALADALLEITPFKFLWGNKYHSISGLLEWLSLSTAKALGIKYESLGMTTTAYEFYSDLKGTGGIKVSNALLTVLLNYNSWVDFMEEVWSIVIPIWDESFSDTQIGLGALKGGLGSLKATLTWNFYADIDLHAIEPSGYHIYFGDMYSDTGFLDLDNLEGGKGATENIFWTNPENGIYEFYIDYFGPSILNDMSQSGICDVTIYFEGKGPTYHIPMSSGSAYVAQIILPDGVISRAEEDIKVQFYPISTYDIPKVHKATYSK